MQDALNVTRTTYRVSDFLSWQRRGGLDLRPPFQRGNVWSAKAKSFFMDTIFRGYPVPLVFLQDQTDPQTYEPKRLVVDGQQRLRTVLAFVDSSCLSDRDDADDFLVSRLHNDEIGGKPFKSLDADAQQRILQFQFSVHVLPPTTSNRLLLEIFARMNSTGTQLNHQELRNARFNGAFKQLAYELSYEEVDRWLRWKLFTRQQIARMTDVEMTSELLSFLLHGFQGRNQKAINDEYQRYDDDVPEQKALQRRLVAELDQIDELFGDGARLELGTEFQETPFRTQGWFYPLFAWIHDLRHTSSVLSKPDERARSLDFARLRHHVAGRISTLRGGGVDDNLLKALRGASTDKKSRRTRYDFLAEGWSRAH